MLGEIVAATEAARDRAVESCEVGRYASSAEAPDEGGQVRVSVHTALKGGGRGRGGGERQGLSAQVSVSFGPDSCSPVPFEVLHRVASMGVNFHRDSVVAVGWEGSPSQAPDGVGAWAGALVVDQRSPLIVKLPVVFSPFARFESQPGRPVFSAWIEHDLYPDAPADLLARGEPYDPERLGVDLVAGAGAELRYHVELENLDTGLRMVTDEVALPHDQGHLTAGSGHGVLDFRGQLFGPYAFVWLYWFDRVGEFVDEFLTEVEGEWCARVVVRGFHVPGGELAVDYAGQPWGAPAVWQHLLLAGSPYLPGDHIAVIEQRGVVVRTVGDGKAALRVFAAVAVPGIGMLLTVAVRNEFHVRGCVVVPLPGNANFSKVVAVRNLEAQTESSQFNVLIPCLMNGNSSVWLLSSFEPYLASYDTFPDGVYVNGGLYSSGTPAESILNRDETNQWPIHALPVSQSARAGCRAYLVGSERLRSWSHPFALPLQALSGFVDVGDTTGNSLSVLVKFSVRYRSIWPPPVGEFSVQERTATTGLNNSEAVARYGRSVSVRAADGYRCKFQNYVAFDSWSGGNVDELADYLIETVIKPFYSGIRGDAEYQDFTVVEILRPPYLLVDTSKVVAGMLVDAPEAPLPPPVSGASPAPAVVIDDAGDSDSIRLFFV